MQDKQFKLSVCCNQWSEVIFLHLKPQVYSSKSVVLNLAVEVLNPTSFIINEPFFVEK